MPVCDSEMLPSSDSRSWSGSTDGWEFPGIGGRHKQNKNCDTKGSSMGDHADCKELVGRQVQVQIEGRTIRTGYVEDVADTADALWLEAYGVQPRPCMKKRRTIPPYLSDQRDEQVMNMQDVEPIEIKVRDRASMDRCITAAVHRMIESARRQRTHGILVTRLGDGHFVVGLSNAVPFGYTDQLDSRRQTDISVDTPPPCRTLEGLPEPRHGASPAEPQIMATWLKSVPATSGESRWPPRGILTIATLGG